jgi:pimeloyl-ACP methyl ester carboxylesterase
VSAALPAHVEVGGLRLAHRRAGRGTPLLLLHGAFADSRSWRPQLEALSDGFDVVAWDAPGCGGSDDPPDDFGREAYGECLVGFVEALGLRRPHVLGLSLGSVLALELYRRAPGLPRSLVLASAYAGWAGSLPPEEVERRIDRAERDLELPPTRWVEGYLPELLTPAAPPETVEATREMMLDTRPAGLRAALRAFGRADLQEVLPAIAVPTLLLYGGHDRRSPPRVGEELNTRIPGSTLVTLPGAGHDANVEAPEAFTAEVCRFLREVEAGSSAAR